jgi:hypothetical protein
MEPLTTELGSPLGSFGASPKRATTPSGNLLGGSMKEGSQVLGMQSGPTIRRCVSAGALQRQTRTAEGGAAEGRAQRPAARENGSTSIPLFFFPLPASPRPAPFAASSTPSQ